MFPVLKWFDGLIEGWLHRNIFLVLFHIPIVGGCLALLFGITFINRWKELPFAIKQGIAAQIFFPGIFAAIAAIKFFLWLFEFELLNHLLFYILAIYLIAAYALMLYATKNILKTGKFQYPFVEPHIQKVAAFVFG